MVLLDDLYQMYDAYEKKAKDVRRRASRYAGVFGLGDDPRKNACHELFFEEVGRWAQAFLEGEPPQQEVGQAVRWILQAADAHRNTDRYGYLYAAQTHTRALIPRMSQEDCRELLPWYDRTYPEGDRLPVQQEVFRLLQDHAGVKTARKPGGILGLFRKG